MPRLREHFDTTEIHTPSMSDGVAGTVHKTGERFCSVSGPGALIGWGGQILNSTSGKYGFDIQSIAKNIGYPIELLNGTRQETLEESQRHKWAILSRFDKKNRPIMFSYAWTQAFGLTLEAAQRIYDDTYNAETNPDPITSYFYAYDPETFAFTQSSLWRLRQDFSGLTGYTGRFAPETKYGVINIESKTSLLQDGGNFREITLLSAIEKPEAYRELDTVQERINSPQGMPPSEAVIMMAPEPMIVLDAYTGKLIWNDAARRIMTPLETQNGTIPGIDSETQQTALFWHLRQNGGIIDQDFLRDDTKVQIGANMCAKRVLRTLSGKNITLYIGTSEKNQSYAERIGTEAVALIRNNALITGSGAYTNSDQFGQHFDKKGMTVLNQLFMSGHTSPTQEPIWLYQQHCAPILVHIQPACKGGNEPAEYGLVPADVPEDPRFRPFHMTPLCEQWPIHGLVRHSGIACSMYDDTTKCVFWSKGMEDLSGRPATEMCGKTGNEIAEIQYKDQDLTNVRQRLAGLAWTKSGYVDLVFVQTVRDGSRIPVLGTTIPYGKGSLRILKHVPKSEQGIYLKQGMYLDPQYPSCIGKKGFEMHLTMLYQEMQAMPEDTVLPMLVLRFPNSLLDKESDSEEQKIVNLTLRRRLLEMWESNFKRSHGFQFFRIDQNEPIIVAISGHASTNTDYQRIVSEASRQAWNQEYVVQIQIDRGKNPKHQTPPRATITHIEAASTMWGVPPRTTTTNPDIQRVIARGLFPAVGRLIPPKENTQEAWKQHVIEQLTTIMAWTDRCANSPALLAQSLEPGTPGWVSANASMFVCHPHPPEIEASARLLGSSNRRGMEGHARAKVVWSKSNR